MLKQSYLAFLLTLLTIVVFGQTPVDTAIKHSPVRTLSDAQYDAYMKGIDINNTGLTAELNHYPLLDDVAKYKKQLDLSPTQITQLNDVLKFLQLKKKEVGGSVIRNEKMLDSLFRTHKVDEGSIVFYANRYGLYEGEYRTAVLIACYRTEKILTARQIKLLEALKKHN